MLPTILAPVKINLALHVGPLRHDGYHPVDTLCVFPAFGDILSYDPEGPFGLDFGGPFGGALGAEGARSNLVIRAFALLGLAPQGRFFLTKRTPIASGMGAGTADGAAAMLLLNEVHGLRFSADELIAQAEGLGADGPVCMAGQIRGGGLHRAQGIGERLSWLGACEAMPILLANPGIAVPTGKVFRRFDADEPGPLSPVRLDGGRGPVAIASANRNDLKPAAAATAPVIGSLLKRLESLPGVRLARMSGSGATCFALFSSQASADRAARALRAEGLWSESAFILPG
jgi:4-diphosphocytidyl-2-C-methyl-D-erythritol kinase